jgi:hypothetical protein
MMSSQDRSLPPLVQFGHLAALGTRQQSFARRLRFSWLAGFIAALADIPNVCYPVAQFNADLKPFMTFDFAPFPASCQGQTVRRLSDSGAVT